MSRKSRMQSLRESKDKRAKRMAIGGAILLAAVLAWEVPHFLNKKTPSSSTSTTTAAATTTPGVTTPTATPAGTAAPAVAPTASTKLPDSDAAPKAGKTALASFSEFPSKDPFVQQVSVPKASPDATGAAPSPASGSSQGSSGSSSVQQASVRTLARGGVAMISVNGKTETVRVGGSFPSSNPVFRLVSLSNGGAQIGIANGSYASGAQTVSLTGGKTLTLVDTADGARYHVRLLGS